MSSSSPRMGIQPRALAAILRAAFGYAPKVVWIDGRAVPTSTLVAFDPPTEVPAAPSPFFVRAPERVEPEPLSVHEE